MAGELYVVTEATKYFVPSSSSAWPQIDVNFNVQSLASGAGYRSDSLDLGTAARSPWFAWRAWLRFATNPSVADSVRIYLMTAGTSNSATDLPDNSEATTQGLIGSEDKTRNLLPLGRIIVDEAASGVHMADSGKIFLLQRNIQVVFYNATTVSLTSNVDQVGFLLTPMPQQQQP